jgi:hypothetical protein
MSRIVRELEDLMPWEGGEIALPLPLIETRLRHDAAEQLADARCPICHGPLQVRMTRYGPAYCCLCDRLPV